MDAPEYAPKWTSNDPDEVIGITERRMSDPPALLLGLHLAGRFYHSSFQKLPDQVEFFCSFAARQFPLRFHQFYWPYWKLYKDSIAIPLSPDANGFATAELPAGHYSIVLKLEKSGFENTGIITSIFGMIVILTLLTIVSYTNITKK